ncbi:MAG: helix-turn-helix transcriptional regulator [Bryobacteraceae bacterium]
MALTYFSEESRLEGGAMDFETLKCRLLVRVRTCVQNGELTERGLARMIGISQPHMHHILKGVRALSLENADRILRRLDLTVLDLMDGLTARRQVPDVALPVVGIEQDEGGGLTSIAVEGWEDAEKFSDPGIRQQEVF